MPTQKKKQKIHPLSSVVQANLDVIVQGKTPEQAEKDNELPKGTLHNVDAKVGELLESTDPNTALQRRIISEALTDRLKPIKEDLSVKSLELTQKADSVLAERLEKSAGMISDKNLLAISDVHSKRLARLTGIEEDPTAGHDDSSLRAKTVNIMVQNIFQGHRERLARERAGINCTPEPTSEPIQGELSPETAWLSPQNMIYCLI